MGHIVSTNNSDHDVDLFDVEVGHTGKDMTLDEDALNIQRREDEASIGEECPICTEEILLRDLAKLDPCNHEFHQECINQWLEDHSTCPNCRQEVCQVVFNYRLCNVTRRHLNQDDEFQNEDQEDTLLSQSDSDSVIEQLESNEDGVDEDEEEVVAH